MIRKDPWLGVTTLLIHAVQDSCIRGKKIIDHCKKVVALKVL